MIQPAIEVILWDNDGVLVDTERLYLQANRDVLATLGMILDDHLFREHFLVGNSGLLSILADRGFSAAEVDEIRERRNARYSELLQVSDFTIPGVAETLQRLHGHVHMAVVTSSLKSHFELIHQRTGFKQYFDFIVAHGDYSDSKPHPAPYLTALERLTCPADHCLVIEDSLRGLQAAKAAGLRCWVIPGPLTRESDFSMADRILTSIEEVASGVFPEHVA